MSGGPNIPRKPELLAPAGGWDAFRAAVANGADAVYLGLKDLNARRGAANFSAEELAEATRHAHLRGRKVYLTANIVTLASEAAAALEAVDSAWTAGVDAVIVQDLGLMRLLRAELPHVRLHASTQINTHNTATVRTLADLGVSRVTLARETSLEEIAAMAGSSDVELESFVHGSLCFCYSGQCLMSSLIGGRSANRGLCAQPCRMAYRLIDQGGHEASCPGAYLLSPKDLAGITLLPRLAHSGLAALKIEGRMKSPEYVALVVGVYRAALDRAWADAEGFAVTPGEWATLEEAFSRGFTEGSLTGKRGEDRMSYRRPNNRGVSVGRIAAVAERRATVPLDRALDADDVIEVWTGRGRFAQKAGEMEVGGKPTRHAPAGVRAVLTLEQPAGSGDRVFRVVNASLLDAARRTYAEERASVPLDIAVTLTVGKPLEVEVSAEGASAVACGPVVEAARTKRVTAEEVAAHVGRLGGTPYFADGWRLNIDPAAGIGFSALHAARRDAVVSLDAARLAPWSSRRPGRPQPPHAPAVPARAARRALALVVAVDSVETASACMQAGAERVLLEVTARDSEVGLPAGVAPLLPRIAHDDEVDRLLSLAAAAGGTPAAGNLGVLRLLGERGAVDADWGLNAANPWTVDTLAELGATFVWASPELSGRQLAALAASSPVPVGVLAYGRVELMVAEHCVLSSSGECDRRCPTCGRRGRRWAIRDQKGYAFPVRTDAMGRSHVHNSVTLDLSRSVAELIEGGVSAVRLELQTLSPEEAAQATSAWRQVLEEAAVGRPPRETPLIEPATSGHFYRGVR